MGKDSVLVLKLLRILIHSAVLSSNPALTHTCLYVPAVVLSKVPVQQTTASSTFSLCTWTQGWIQPCEAEASPTCGSQGPRLQALLTNSQKLPLINWGGLYLQDNWCYINHMPCLVNGVAQILGPIYWYLLTQLAPTRGYCTFSSHIVGIIELMSTDTLHE